MNYLHGAVRREAEDAAVYLLGLSFAGSIKEGDTLRAVVKRAELLKDRSFREEGMLRILQNALERRPELAASVVEALTYSPNGLTACAFVQPDGTVFVVFKGTGGGEWIDNGEGLSGIPEENTYISYGKDGQELSRQVVREDYGTDQQVEALNWFSRIAAKNGWSEQDRIILAGHSKGGNKAQFVTLHSALADECYSFDGQGFSPEALAEFKNRLGRDYELRRQNIQSFSAEDDYVNVLGHRLMPENQIYYFRSHLGLHYLEAILTEDGRLRPQAEQGKLSQYVEDVSRTLMQKKPAVRQYATLGVMNVFQKYLGRGEPVNGDAVSVEKTIAGLAVAFRALTAPSRPQSLLL